MITFFFDLQRHKKQQSCTHVHLPIGFLCYQIPTEMQRMKQRLHTNYTQKVDRWEQLGKSMIIFFFDLQRHKKQQSCAQVRLPIGFSC